MLVEGVRAVTEALDAGANGRFAVTSPRLGHTSGGSALATRLAAADLEVHAVDDAELSELADTEHAQGVLLVCSEPRSSLDLVEAGVRLLVLDGVQDPGNTGTLGAGLGRLWPRCGNRARGDSGPLGAQDGTGVRRYGVSNSGGFRRVCSTPSPCSSALECRCASRPRSARRSGGMWTCVGAVSR